MAFPCRYCPKGFCTKKSLSDHISKVHNKIRWEFECKKCVKYFETSQGLKHHNSHFHSASSATKSAAAANFILNEAEEDKGDPGSPDEWESDEDLSRFILSDSKHITTSDLSTTDEKISMHSRKHPKPPSNSSSRASAAEKPQKKILKKQKSGAKHRFCTNCGEQLWESGQQFCGNCGHKVVSKPTEIKVYRGVFSLKYNFWKHFQKLHFRN